MSCNDDKIRNQTCVKKYYYKNGECAPCRDPKCHFCFDGIGCIQSFSEMIKYLHKNNIKRNYK